MSSSQCGLYMAESSIPNSGWGMYTGMALTHGEPLFHPEIVVQAMDPVWHLRRYEQVNQGDDGDEPRERIEASDWLMHSYYWNPDLTRGVHEADTVHSIFPGLGMLANSHTGLVNVDLLRPSIVDGSCVDLAHCRHGPDAGAATPYHGKESLANGDMEAGMELFVAYGDEWFADREWKFGVLPLSHDFLDADEIIQDFYETHKTALQNIDDNNNTILDLQDRWDAIGMNQKDEGLVMALPSDVRDIKEVHETGSARYSVPNVVRSLEWLDEYGFCLDNIEPKMSLSVVGQRGAFATRSLQEGQVIAPAPLVHMQRHFLHLYQRQNTDDPQLVSDQLLLNYCFGHANSSLVFFPYAPIVNYINHSPTVPNAKVRWSQHSAYEHADWIHTKSLDDIVEYDSAGLLMEFVATRDIAQGDEILIDYGAQWEDAWNTHVQQWTAPPSDAETYFPAAYWNEKEQLIQTSQEQSEHHPYPSNVMILCFLPRNFQNMYHINNSTKIGPQYIWEPEEDNDDSDLDMMVNGKECEILKRTIRRNDDEEESSYYGVRVPGREGTSWIIVGLPRHFVEFYDRPYTSNQHLRRAFRHEIHLPDDMFPSNWMDLIPSNSNPNEDTDKTPTSEQSLETCGLYLAESSISDAGFGLYTGKDISSGDDISYPDLAIQVEPNSGVSSAGLLDPFFWDANKVDASKEAKDVRSLVPGIGMLANSHPGLDNALFQDLKVDSAGLHRSKDTGTGGFTNYHDVRHMANTFIPAGMELFPNNGDSWFLSRNETIGNIPLRRDYSAADELLEEFWSLVEGDVTSEFAKDLWKYTGIVSDRVKKALPTDLDGVLDVMQNYYQSTAVYSIPKSTRSLDWLNENGLCVDNIKPGPSTISQAGRGAFATRSIPRGHTITSSPIIPIHRQQKIMHASQGTESLLLNYCYGYPNFPVLLFPYGPVVNFINHNSIEPNAYVRWSNFTTHKQEWLRMSVDELMYQDTVKPLLEFVATRDILAGEEVMIDYGSRWEEAWDKHVETWNPPQGAEDYVSASELNVNGTVPLRTMEQQKEHPYPSSVRTVCTVPLQKVMKKSTTDGAYTWKSVENLVHAQCDIVHRILGDDHRRDSIRPVETLYTARIYHDNEDFLVSGIPRREIRFHDVEHTADQYLGNAFRREIDLPERMLPSALLATKE